MLMKPLSACLAAVALMGCTSITPAGLRAALQLNPLETSPAELSVAVSVPGSVQLSDGDAVMVLGFVPDDPRLAAPVWAKVPLSVAAHAAAPEPLSSEDRVYVLKLDADAAKEMAEAQARIKARKSEGIAGTGSFSIGVEGGCLKAPLTSGFPVSTWLQADPGAEFVLLTRRTDLFEVLEPVEAQALREQLRPC